MSKGNWRDDLDQKLLGVLDSQGVGNFLDLATAMLSVNAGADPQLKAQFVGEVCECVFWGLTREYLKTSGKQARVFHSVVLKDLQNVKSNFRTELDFILVSPSFILTTECKSYAGTVTVKDECTLVHRGKSSNVWSQSKLHYDKLMLYSQQLSLPSAQVARLPVYANVFLFSDSKIKDVRSNPNLIRITTASTILNYYDAMFKSYTKPVFDYARACKVFGVCSASTRLHEQHGKYVGY